MKIIKNSLFFYRWGKYPNSFVILQGFNLMLTKAIFIYWQPYVAFVNILQRRDVWKYVFDLFLNIKVLSEMFIDCKCWYDQNCSVDDQNCLWMRIKHDDGLEIFQKMMASWIPFKKSKVKRNSTRLMKIFLKVGGLINAAEGKLDAGNSWLNLGNCSRGGVSFRNRRSSFWRNIWRRWRHSLDWDGSSIWGLIGCRWKLDWCWEHHS